MRFIKTKNYLLHLTASLLLIQALFQTSIEHHAYSSTSSQVCANLFDQLSRPEISDGLLHIDNKSYKLIGVADLFDVQRNTENASRHITPLEKELNIRFETRPDLLNKTNHEFAELKRVASIKKKEAVRELFIGIYFYYLKRNIPERASIFGHSIMQKVSDYYVEKYKWNLINQGDWTFNVNEYDGVHHFFTDDILNLYGDFIRTARVNSSNPDYLDIYLENGRLIRVITRSRPETKYPKLTQMQTELLESRYREFGYFDDPAIAEGLAEDKKQMQATGAAVPILVFEDVKFDSKK